MRSYLALVFVCLFIGNAHAQLYSLGLRAGITGWRFIDPNLNVAKANASFTKEVFIQGSGYGRWAFEVAFAHDRYQSDQLPFPDAYTHPPEFHVDRAAYQLHLKGSYEVLENSPSMKRFKNYIGFVATPMVTMIKTNDLYQSTPNNPQSAYRLEYTMFAFEVWLGFSNTLEYQLTDRLYLTGVLGLQGNPFSIRKERFRASFNAKYYPNVSYTGTLGIACRL